MLPARLRHPAAARAAGRCQLAIALDNAVERALIEAAPALPAEDGPRLGDLLDEARLLALRHKRLAAAIVELFADVTDPQPPAMAAVLAAAA